MKNALTQSNAPSVPKSGTLGALVPRAGIEPARPFRAKGFSYHYGFRHQFLFVVWTIPSPWGNAL